MDILSQSPEVAFAVRTVRKAALLAKQIQAGMAIMNLTKSDLSPATVADFGIQALAAHALSEAFPNDTLVAEESSTDLRANPEVLKTVTQFVTRHLPEADSEAVCRLIDQGAKTSAGRFWALDPIDGTKGYRRGGQYAVGLALIEDGRVRLGVMGCPNLGDTCTPDSCGVGALIAAVRGQGVWHTSLSSDGPCTPMHVSSCGDPAQARLLRSNEASHTNAVQVDALAKALGLKADPVLMDSMAKYAVLGAGHGELLVRLLSSKEPDYREKVWDVAPGSIVVEEAGGRVTDLDGKSLDFSTGRRLERNRGILASNGALHDVALKALAHVEGGR